MLDEVVREAARRFGDRPAFVTDDGRTLSYAQLDERSDRVAAGLVDLDIGPGDVVALVLPSDLDYVVAYAGVAKVGAAAAGVNPKLAPGERAAIVERADADLVITTSGLANGIALRRPVTAVLPHGEHPAPRLGPDPDRVAAIVFTSGTTGLPRGAVFRNRQLEAVRRIDLGDDRQHSWDGGGAMLASTQFAHIGFMTKLPWYLQTGTTTHILGSWRADDVLRTIAATRMTVIGGVTPQLALMMRSPMLDVLDLSAVRTIVMGGAASPPALIDEARERLGAVYSVRYSSTECGGVGLVADFAPGDPVRDTVGRPRPGVEVTVRDETGAEVPTGEVGELWIRSDATMDGYWKDPAGTTAALTDDGWLRTGDLAAMSDDDGHGGEIRLAGRLKDMFIRGGYNVYPAEVAGVLGDHPAVADVAVVGSPEPVMGEVGVAVVVARDRSRPPTLADLREHGANRLARWKLPEAMVVVDDLPLTAMHKLDRAELARLAAMAVAEQHRDEPADAATTGDRR